MSLSVNIKKKYGDFQLDVAFEAGNEVLSLLGASGCGKSLTLRCIAGIETPDEGRIVINGETVFDSERRIDLKPQKRRVGMLFQNYALFPNMTVEENILCGLEGVRDKKERKVRCREAVSAFQLEGLEAHLPHQLSGGQQQRVALARMLVSEPAILLLDEPFSALDSHLRSELEGELKSRLEAFGGTAIFVSHSREEVYRLSDRIAVYNKGRIDVCDSRDQVFKHPRTCQAARLTGCENLTEAVWRNGKVWLPGWELELTLPHGEKTPWLGIRAGDLRPAREPGENVFPYETLLVQPEPFGQTRLIRKAGSDGTGLIRWYLPREQEDLPLTGLAELPKECLMGLSE